MAEDKKLSQLIINEMTKAQYDALDRVNEDEIYILTDAENTVKTDTTSIVGDGSIQNPIAIAPAILTKIDTEISERTEKDSEIEQSLTTLTNTTTNHINDKHNPHEVTKDQVGLGNVDNTSDIDKPISTATQTALNTAISTEKLAREQAISQEITDRTNADDALRTKITNIETLIPQEASATNKLADKTYVSDSIQQLAAFYITSNTAGDAFATKAALLAGPYYFQGTERQITLNDYAIVIKDETKNNASSRYMYDGKQWDFQYIVNDTPFTQEQLDAINSGINSTSKTSYDNHLLNKSNPHEVTKTQVGLENVDNTSDLDKPISTATQTALDGKVSKAGDVITGDLEFSTKGIYLESIGSSVSASKSRLNLGSPGNVYSYLTGNKNGAFGIYSESSGSRTGIACYPGENFFADAPTETVTLGRNTNVWSTAYIKKLSNGTVSSETSDLIGHLSDTNNPHEVTKDQVGLGNVDNTSDLDKPISTATQTALNNKQNKLTAGTNIAINNDTISATDTKYTAGTNISISNDNVISAIDTKYTAGTDITISNNVVSNKYPEVFLTQEEYNVLVNNNQIDPNTYYNTIDTSVPLNTDDIIFILPSLNEGDSLKQGTLAFVEV